MTEQESRSKAEARCERGSEGNHLSMDTVASGMAAAGLGLALLQQDISDAKAAENFRPHEDRATSGVSHDDVQSHAAPAHDAPVTDMNAVAPSQPTAEQAVSHVEAAPSHSATSTTAHSSEAAIAPSGQAPSPGAIEAPSAATQTAPTMEHVDASQGIASGIQNLLASATSSITGTIESTLDQVSNGLSTLSSQLGDLLGGQASSLSSTIDHTVDALSDTLAVPAAIDSVFHQAFGPASDLHSFASDVVDTRGLASFGSLSHDTPLSFLAQSYTDVADQSVHGLQGLTHGLI